VLLEAGHNSPSTTFEELQRQIALFTRVCRYDRAGLGGSDPDPAQRPRSAAASVADLEAVAAHIDSGPLVLVGHSLGGALVRLYAAANPDKIAALVLLDATHERESEAVDEMLTPDQRAAGAGMQPLSPEGLDVQSILGELRASRSPPSQPVLVIARGRPLQADEMPPTWTAEQRMRREQIRKALQGNLARMHPRGELIIANRSGHFVHRDEPQLVVSTLRDLVSELRSRAATPNK
jgi:pimeloyl-ACP methyl ester carboxylesterase